MIFRHSELTLFDSRAMRGIAQATGSRQRVCATFHSQCGILHINVSWTCLCGCYQGTLEHEHDDDILVHDDAPVRDVTIACRSVALVHSGDSRATFRRLCFESVDLAIVWRIPAREFVSGVWTRPKTSVPALQPWKVRRVIEYIDANISEPIRLADIAAMRQVSPHTYSFAHHPKSNGLRQLSKHSDQETPYIAWSIDFKSQSKPYERLKAIGWIDTEPLVRGIRMLARVRQKGGATSSC